MATRNQFTRAEGHNVTVVNVGDSDSLDRNESDGSMMSTFFGGGSSAISRAATHQPTVHASRAAAEADALFLPLCKYGAVAAGFLWGLPLLGESLHAVGPIAAIGVVAWFFFVRKKS